MSNNNNGFQEMLDYTTTLTRVDPVKVTKESLLEAAEFFVEKLLPNIPESLRKKKHMKDHIKIEVKEDVVTVYFENTAYYWRFIENGTKNIKAEHFVEGTWEQFGKEIETIMSKSLLEKMEG